MDKIIIFDTTLRDGEQCPGASLNSQEKMEIARQLARLGVDVIEAGFPVSSPGDFDAVKSIAKTIRGPIICGLARAVKKDIDRACEAVRFAKRPRVHIFLATSKIHMQYKLKKPEEEILELAAWAVKSARKRIGDVEFSPEDASRSDRGFLYKVIETVIDAGASTVNIPDTVGYAVPWEFGSLIRDIRFNVPNIDKCVISVHCHNDLGLAVANSISAVENGARQVECTINGLGERAGNASLEEIVMALDTRKDVFNAKTGIDNRQIYKTSRMVSKLTGMVVQANKAIVGANAFSHESGIHQDGILKKRTTYEIMRPQDVGFAETKLVLGKHSGRHAFSDRLKKLGFKLSEAETAKAFERFKDIADKKKSVFDDDIIAILEDEITTTPERYSLDEFRVNSGNKTTPEATVVLRVPGKRTARASSEGDGPVDACYKAIDKITGLKMKLVDYSLKAVTHGQDAMGEVTVQVRSKEKTVTARGASTDVLEASVKAYINAVNRLYAKSKTKAPAYSL